VVSYIIILLAAVVLKMEELEGIHGLDQIKMVLHLSQKEQVVVAAAVVVP
jgi:hypothetical protein